MRVSKQLSWVFFLALSPRLPAPAAEVQTNSEVPLQSQPAQESWTIPSGASAAHVGTNVIWSYDSSSRQNYERALAHYRENLRNAVGAAALRLTAGSFETVTNHPAPARPPEPKLFSVRTVRWPVVEGGVGEGLLLHPKAGPRARVVLVIPEAAETSEQIAGLAPGIPAARQLARRLAENGCEVLVLGDSGGRNGIGPEVQEVLAAIDCFEQENTPAVTNQLTHAATRVSIGVAGCGRGARIALFSAAVDSRIDAALVSGYFGAHLPVNEEPLGVESNSLVAWYGDAEIATLVAPRNLIVEHSPEPSSPATGAKQGAGKSSTPDYARVEAELDRARNLLNAAGTNHFDHFTLISGPEGMVTGPGSDRALVALLQALSIPIEELRD